MENISCTVSFQKQVSREHLRNTIELSQNPKVIFWYIGAHGFKADGAKYYREDFKNILSFKNNPECILYDMTAWSGLRKASKISLNDINPNVNRINSFGIKGIRATTSSQFFSWIKNLDDPC
jgi:hypothetical protein